MGIKKNKSAQYGIELNGAEQSGIEQNGISRNIRTKSINPFESLFAVARLQYKHIPSTLFFTIAYHSIISYNTLYYSVLSYLISYIYILYCTVLYCSVLFSSQSHGLEERMFITTTFAASLSLYSSLSLSLSLSLCLSLFYFSFFHFCMQSAHVRQDLMSCLTGLQCTLPRPLSLCPTTPSTAHLQVRHIMCCHVLFYINLLISQFSTVLKLLFFTCLQFNYYGI